MTFMTTQIHVTDEWREVARVVDRYEEAVGDQLPDVAQLLRGVSASNRRTALLELLQVEQEHRWRRRQGKTVEEYLDQYPELRTDRDAERQLARSECRLRCGTGDHDFRKDFSRRFPDLELECDTLGDAATATAATRTNHCKTCPLVRPPVIGHYEVEKRIGGGTYGVVYRCRDRELDRLVAIKVARDASGGVEAFKHEAKNVAHLAHPNIVGLLEYGKLDDGRPYIVYEYVAGKTLADRIAAHDYSPGEAIRWTIALAGALQAAHRRRIYHRDIKPANILVDKEGVVRLTDFGLARREDLFYFDDQGTCLGTLAYMSPEQASYHSDWAGPASDIYSLGVVLYELLCGQVPFRDTKLESLITQIKERSPDSLRSQKKHIPVRVEEACLRALAKDPAKRFRTAGDFARALQTAIEPRPRRIWLVVAVAAWLTALGLCIPPSDPPSPVALQTIRPRIDVISDGGTPQDMDPERLPHSGDELRIFTRLNKKAHVYVYVIVSQSGEARILTELDKAEPMALCDTMVTVPPGDGTMTVVIGARGEPLKVGALNDFIAKTKSDWPGTPKAGKLESFPATGPNVIHPSPHDTLRGGNVFDFPEGFRQELETLFHRTDDETYYAKMFPWVAKQPGSDRIHAP